MSERETFNRPPRILRVLPSEEIEIPAPPPMPSAGVPTDWTFVVLPVATSILYLIILIARGGQGGSIWFSLPIIAISLLSAGFGIWRYLERKRAYEEAKQQYITSYRHVLIDVRNRLEELQREQRFIHFENNPNLDQLLQILELERRDRLPQPRLWERRPTDDDFLLLRVGTGTLPSSVKIKPPRANEFQLTPELKEALELAKRYMTVDNVPITVSLRQYPILGVASSVDRERDRYEFAFWLLLQIVTHHSPVDVRLAGFWFRSDDSLWSWLRWLPHTRAFDDDSYRLLARYDGAPTHLQQVVRALQGELQQRREHGIKGRPHLVVVLDRYDRVAGQFAGLDQLVEAGPALGMSFLCLVPEPRQTPSIGHGYVSLKDAELALSGEAGYRKSIRPDSVDRKTIERVARRLAGLDTVQLETRYVLPHTVRFSTLLGLGELRRYDPTQYWQEPEDPYQSWHPVPVGMISVDQPLEINLNEGIHGVHGIIAGTTGSGKSEFLLTFLMALAVRHPPQRLQFMLIDFKGGATFKDLEPLPHTVGMVTDLSGNEAQRALVAINSELDRRKRILKKQGVTNIREYRRDAQRYGWPPMANLMIAIDEFDEMVRDYPDFVNELIRVAKQGRSLGVHLLFATQQPSQVKEGLLRNITYRIALRVTAPEDSKAMVGIPDAAYLTTATPGRGYFGVNKQVSVFQSARITLPYQPATDDESADVFDVTGRREPEDALDSVLDRTLELIEQNQLEQTYNKISEYYQTVAGRALRTDEQQKLVGELRRIVQTPDRSKKQLREELRKLIERLLAFRETELQLITAVMHEKGTRPASIWNPPLPPFLSLGDQRLQLGRQSPLSTVIALSDDPVEVSQDPVVYNALSPQMNLLAIGSAQSGKTTLLRTLMLGLAYTTPPDQICFYVIDATGQACGLLRGDQERVVVQQNGLPARLPHLADAMTAQDLERIDRLLFELDNTILQRREWCRRYHVDTLAAYIAKRGKDPTLPPAPPYILVVIDNIAELGEKFDAFLQRLQEGRPYGIAFAVTANAERDIKQKRLLFDMQIVLRVSDPNESDMLLNKKFAAFISEKNPGRAFLRRSQKPMELHIALPVLTPIEAPTADQEDTYLDIEADMQQMMNEIIKRHPVSVADRRLRLLEKQVTLTQLLAETSSLQVPFARNGRDLQPITFDLTGNPPDLLIAGGSGSGKSTALRTLLTAFVQQYSADDVQFVLIDYSRRTLEPFAQTTYAREWQVIVPETLPQAPSPPSNRSQWKGTRRIIRMATDDTETGALCLALYDELQRRKQTRQQTPRLLLVIEGLDLITTQQEWSYLNLLAPFVMRGSDLGFHVIISATTYSSFSSQGLIKAMSQRQQMIFLGKPANPDQEVNVGFKWPKEFAGISFPTGRGVIRLPRVPYSVVHVAGISEEEVADTLRRYYKAETVLPVEEEEPEVVAPPPPQEAPRPLVAPDLPAVIPLRELLTETAPTFIPLGRCTQDLRPLGFDVNTDTLDLLISGGSQTGKSNLVRVILMGLMERYQPGEIEFALVSYAPALHLFTHSKYVPNWEVTLPDKLPTSAPNPPSNRDGYKNRNTFHIASRYEDMCGLCLALYDKLHARFSEGKKGHQIVLVVEDIDLMSSAELNFLSILAPFLNRGNGVGFHAILTATTFAHAANNPFYKALQQKQRAICLGKPLHLSRDSIGFDWPNQYSELDFPVGRGVLRLPDLPPTLIQTAFVSPEEIAEKCRRTDYDLQRIEPRSASAGRSMRTGYE